MKINEQGRNELIKNMEELKVDCLSTIETFITALKNAETVEDIMGAKQYLLRQLIYTLPLGTHYCYFCLAPADCDACEYAKIHKRCQNSNSDFQKIMKARSAIQDAIDKFYYTRNERY